MGNVVGGRTAGGHSQLYSGAAHPKPTGLMLLQGLLHASPNFGQDQRESSGGFLLSQLPAAGKETAAPKGHEFSKIRSPTPATPPSSHASTEHRAGKGSHFCWAPKFKR